MKKSTIQQLRSIKQDAKDGIFSMKGISFTKLLHNLIREHGTYAHGSYEVNPNDFTLTDKKLIISYFVDSEEYEEVYSNPIKLESLFTEYFDDIEAAIDDECYAVYCDDMEEMGMSRCSHPNNDEVYWVRR